MNKKQRKNQFWKFLLISTALLLFIASCKPTSSQTGIPKPYNLTLMGNASGIVGLTQLVNSELMDNLFGIMILVAIFAISLMAFMVSTGHAGKSIATSSFIVFALSILLRGINLVPDYAIYVTLAMAALSIAFLKTRD